MNKTSIRASRRVGCLDLFRPLTLLALAAACLAAACSRDQRPELVIYVRSTTPVQDHIWFNIAGAFQAKRPELKIKVLDIPYDAYWPKLFTMISSGNPPDLVLMESGLYPSFVAKGAFLDLAPLIRQTPGFSLGDYYPNALKWLWIDERIYGLPTDTAIFLPVFNMDLFDKFGVPYPAENWTWDDYLELAKRLTHDTNGDGKTDVFGTFLPPWEACVWSWGGDWTDNAEHPTRCTFDQPANLQAIRWLLDMRNKYKVTPRETSTTAQMDPFIIQKVAIVWNGHWAMPDYELKCKFRWDVATLPRGPKRRAGWNFGSCFSIPARTRHPAEAWEAVRFFSGPEGLGLMAKENFITPALRSVAENPDFLNHHPPLHHRRFIDAIADGCLFPKTPYYKELDQEIINELERVWAGDATPESACATIARRGTEILKGAEDE